MTTFTKPFLSPAQHISQWRKRGLAVPDTARATRYLTVISYYRLSAYTLPFQLRNQGHAFIPGTSFEDVLDLYIFDRQLRLLILDAIERIEVALRACWLMQLFRQHPKVDTARMGMPDNWAADPFWQMGAAAETA